MRPNRLAPMTVALLIGLAVAGCGGGSTPAAAGATTTSSPTHHHHPRPTVTVTDTVAPTTATTPTVVTPSPSTPAVSYCTGSQLHLSLGEQQGAAGKFYTPIILTDSSATACQLRGYPGVSYLDSSGQEVGPTASQRMADRVTVTLQPGGSASTMLEQTDPGVYSTADCMPEPTVTVRVYPPGLYRSLTVKDMTSICTSPTIRSSISVLQAGTQPSD